MKIISSQQLNPTSGLFGTDSFICSNYFHHLITYYAQTEPNIHHLSNLVVVLSNSLIKNSLDLSRIQLLLTVESIQSVDLLLNIGPVTNR